MHVTFSHREHLDIVAKCDICGKGYGTKAGLYVHKSLKHGVYGSNSEGEPNWAKNVKTKIICDICGKATSRVNHKNHMKSHANAANKPTKCMYCDKEFAKFSNMTGHRKFAHPEEYKRDRVALMEKEGSQYLNKEHPSSKIYAKKMREKKKLSMGKVTT